MNPKLYKWRDDLGELPPAVMRVICHEGDTGNLYLEHLLNKKWVKVAHRLDGQWVSHFVNMRIEEDGDKLGCFEFPAKPK
jgi:hypothetical protein